MADASIKVDPKQLKNYSNNIKTGYRQRGKGCGRTGCSEHEPDVWI